MSYQGLRYLRYKQQLEFFLSPPFDARNHFSFVATEGNIFFIDVPVPNLQFCQQSALGHLPVSLEAVSPHIVGQYADEQGIAPQITEHAAQLVQIRPQNGITLGFGDAVGELFSGQYLVSPTYVRPMLLFTMPTLKVMSSLS